MKLAYLIEASGTYQKMIQQHLQQLGFEVRSFVTASECLQKLQQKPDLILLSQQLENDEKGTDFIRHFKNKIDNVPVVVLSNEGDVYTGVMALKLGAMDYIEKNGAALVRLRTAIDGIPDFLRQQRRKRILRWVIGIAALSVLVAGIWIGRIF
jgi:DNA-binding response OmpR family regulator